MSSSQYASPSNSSTSVSSVDPGSTSQFSGSEAVDSRSSSLYRFNYAFIRHSWYVLKNGLGSPLQEPVLWLVIAFNLACQALTPYNIQNYFYIVATGRDSVYPGIGGCLKSGCGGIKTSPGDTNLVIYYMGQFAWMFIITLFGVGCMAVSGDVINVRMRARLTRHFQNRLFADNKLWYRLSLDNALDNIDQRISSDLQQHIDGITVCLFGNTADYMIYPIGFTFARMTLAFNNAISPLGSSVQLQILWSLLAMAAVAMFAYIFPMNRISALFGTGQRLEGEFRATHTRVVLNAESIAMMDGERSEKELAIMQYKRLEKNKQRYYLVQGGLMFLKLIATITQPNIAYMMLALTSITNSTTANFFIKQLGDVLEYLLYFPAIIARLAFAAGAGHRVGELLDRMAVMERTPLSTPLNDGAGDEPVVVSDDKVSLIELQNVTANPPIQHELSNGQDLSLLDRMKSCFSCQGEEDDDEAVELQSKRKFLFDDVTLRVEKGESVVIMGPSGCGKSSLLRVIGDLWGISKGKVTHPSPKNMFFLPQRPYVFPGTLLELITYPETPADDAHPDGVKYDKDSINRILEFAFLSHLSIKYGLDAVQPWPTLLSASEQQRVNFARLFLRAPAFCLSDESSSAMDLRTEAALLQYATQTMKITMVSVAHRPSVVHHHKHVFLYDKPTHKWNLVPASSVATIDDKFEVDGAAMVEEAARIARSEAESDKNASPRNKESDVINVEVDEDKAAGGITLLFWKRLWNLMVLTSPSFFSTEVLMFFLMMLSMGINGAVIIIVFKYYPTAGIVSDVIAGNNSNAFNAAGVYLGVNVVSAVVQSISSVLGALLTVRIQSAVLRRFHSLYFQPRVPYFLNSVTKFKGIDQRMVQDLSALRESLSWLFGSPFSFQQYRSGLLPQLMTFFLLIGYAFSIAWSLTVLFLIVLVIAVVWQSVSSIVTAKYTQQKQAREGTLRLHYGRVLHNVESITFFRGQGRELSVASQFSDSLERTSLTLMLFLALTTFPSVAIYYWLQNGEYEMSALMQVYWSWARLDTANLLTILPFCVLCGKAVMEVVKALGGLGGLAGLTHRVSEVLEAVELQVSTLNEHHHDFRGVDVDSPSGGGAGGGGGGNQSVGATDLALSTPVSRGNEPIKLLENINFKVQRGEALLIMGPSGCGKSGILRCISGLWTPTRGTIQRPSKIGKEGIMFAPQTVYCPPGSLASQLIYPLKPSITDTDSDAILSQCLISVGLEDVLSKWTLHRPANWSLVLSGGEQQRLSLARILYHSPAVAILDESTSALDAVTERMCMTAIKEPERNMAIVSVGSRPKLRAYHQRIMQFNTDNTYTISPTQQQSKRDSSSSSSSSSSTSTDIEEEKEYEHSVITLHHS